MRHSILETKRSPKIYLYTVYVRQCQLISTAYICLHQHIASELNWCQWKSVAYCMPLYQYSRQYIYICDKKEVFKHYWHVNFESIHRCQKHCSWLTSQPFFPNGVCYYTLDIWTTDQAYQQCNTSYILPPCSMIGVQYVPIYATLQSVLKLLFVVTMYVYSTYL